MPSFVLWAEAHWYDMFHLTLPVGEKVVRPILVYFSLVIGLRIFGKRELAQLNPFDLVVLLSLSNTVQNAIIGDDTSLTGGLIGALSLLSVNYLVIRFLFKHRRLDQLLEGKPTTLIRGGRVVERGMAKELITKSELLTILHRQGFSSLEEVDRCVLEPGGTFAIQGKEPRAYERRHDEILKKFDAISRQLEVLSARLDARPSDDGTSTIQST